MFILIAIVVMRAAFRPSWTQYRSTWLVVNMWRWGDYFELNDVFSGLLASRTARLRPRKIFVSTASWGPPPSGKSTTSQKYYWYDCFQDNGRTSILWEYQVLAAKIPLYSKKTEWVQNNTVSSFVQYHCNYLCFPPTTTSDQTVVKGTW